MTLNLVSALLFLTLITFTTDSFAAAIQSNNTPTIQVLRRYVPIDSDESEAHYHPVTACNQLGVSFLTHFEPNLYSRFTHEEITAITRDIEGVATAPLDQNLCEQLGAILASNIGTSWIYSENRGPDHNADLLRIMNTPYGIACRNRFARNTGTRPEDVMAALGIIEEEHIPDPSRLPGHVPPAPAVINLSFFEKAKNHVVDNKVAYIGGAAVTTALVALIVYDLKYRKKSWLRSFFSKDSSLVDPALAANPEDLANTAA